MKKSLGLLIFLSFSVLFAGIWKDRDYDQPNVLNETGYGLLGFDCVNTPKSGIYATGLLEATVTNSAGSSIVVGAAQRFGVSEWAFGILDVSATPDWDGTADAGCEDDTNNDCQLNPASAHQNNDGGIIAADAIFDIACFDMSNGTNGASVGTFGMAYYDGTNMTALTALVNRSAFSDWETGDGKICVAFRAPHDWVTGCTTAVATAANCSGKYVALFRWTTALDAQIIADQIQVGKIIKSQESLADNSSMVLDYDPNDFILGDEARCFMPFFSTSNALNSVFLRYREFE